MSICPNTVDTLLVDYDHVQAQIEAVERAAGVSVGSWRHANAVAWQLAVQAGLRRRVALDVVAARRARSRCIGEA